MDAFRDKLSDALRKRGSLSTQDVYALFPEMNRSTVSWHLHDELEKGMISRKGHGVYVASATIPEQDERFSNIPELSRSAFGILDRSGYEFYLSGLDCLNGLGVKVDGSYPVIVCTRAKDVKNVQLDLMRAMDLAVTEDEGQMLSDENLRRRIQFVVLSSSDFTLQKNGFAYQEKAFVDLYYAATRLEYPLPVKELPHLLSIIEPTPLQVQAGDKGQASVR
ncbi:MAG: hypothetical protein IJ863_06735 [Spirochaetales bacterium]|nr:hypothetical protein [Spirochaetales bacterium]